MLEVKDVIAIWNARVARLKGYKSSDVLGRHFSLLYPLEDQVTADLRARWQSPHAVAFSQAKAGAPVGMAAVYSAYTKKGGADAPPSLGRKCPRSKAGSLYP